MESFPPTVVVTLRGELNEPEEQRGELCVVHVLLSGGTVGSHAESLGLGVPLEGIEVEHGAGVHEAGDGGEEADVPAVLEAVQHGRLGLDVAPAQDGDAEVERGLDHVPGLAAARRHLVQDHVGGAPVRQPALAI